MDFRSLTFYLFEIGGFREEKFYFTVNLSRVLCFISYCHVKCIVFARVLNEGGLGKIVPNRKC